MIRPLLMLALACGAVQAADATRPGDLPRNEFGGIIEPPLDWGGYPKPARTGKFDGELKAPKTNAFIMKYLMFAPAKLPEKKTLGLVLCFHGFKSNEGAMAPPVQESMKAAGLAENYVVIGLKSQGEGWADIDERLVLQTIDWLKSTYPIDPRRVFVWGMSNGGWMVSSFGGKHQDSIAGIVRYCGYPPSAPSAKDAANTQTEYYLVHGDADEAVGVDGSRKLRQSLLQQGYHFVYREMDGLGHVPIINNTDVREDACRWIDALRHKQVPLQAEEEKFLRQFADAKKAAPLFSKPDTWGELLRIAGPQAGVIIARAFKSDSATVRENAATACSKSLFAGDETVEGLIHLTEDKTAGVRQAAITALGVAANWRYEQAQLTLGRIALKKKSDLGQRGGAATLLAAAAVRPLLGNFDDDVPVFQALVALMDDEEKSLREAAFAPLKAAVKDGLGYDPSVTAKERAGAIAKWQQWFTERNKSPGPKTAAR
jgi:predicted esterase